MTSAERTPFVAAALRPRKNANVVGSVGVVWSIAVRASITTCECPMIWP